MTSVQSAPKKPRKKAKPLSSTPDAARQKKKGALKKKQKPKPVQPIKVVEESEKIPFSEVGTENNIVVPPPMVKPVTPVVKVRNRTPLPMPEPPLPDSSDNVEMDE